MKKQALAVFALITPALTSGTGCVPAQSSTGQHLEREQQSAQEDQPERQRVGYIKSTPANGIQANGLIGAEVRTTSDEDVGTVNDLIIDEKGQIVAVIVGVDGLLGMSQKDVAVDWGDTKRSVTSEEVTLRIDMTLDDLGAMPAFETLE